MDHASTGMNDRVASLVGSLVGVAHVRLVTDQSGRLTRICVTREGRLHPHQLSKNIETALRAGMGLRISTDAIVIGDRPIGDDAVTPQPAAAPAEVMPAAPVRPATAESTPSPSPATALPSAADAPVPGAGPTPEARPLSVLPPAAPPLPAAARESMAGHVAEALLFGAPDGDAEDGILAAVAVERQQDRLACRVVVSLQGATFTAVADAPDGPLAEAELAARVACDALRSAGLPIYAVAGAAMTSLVGTSFVLAALRPWHADSEAPPLIGVAPITNSVAHAAAAAVIKAVVAQRSVNLRPTITEKIG